MTTRRMVLKGLIVSVGGATLLSACGGIGTVVATKTGSTKWRFFTEDEIALVSRVSDLLLPRTDTPGALDVNVPGFIDGLMADWANDSTALVQRRNLHELNQLLDKVIDGSFIDSPIDIAEQALAKFDAQAFEHGTNAGYKALKSLITQSYFASEGGATEELKWVATPGRWDPKVAI